MAKRQTRRAISLNRGVYERLKAHCERERVPMARVVEALINRRLEGAQRRVTQPEEPTT